MLAGVHAGLYPVGGAASEPKLRLEIELSGTPQQEFLVLNDAGSPRLRELFQQGLRLPVTSL